MALPQWLLDRPPLTRQQLVEAASAARRYLERSTETMRVETERVIVALADLAGMYYDAARSAPEVKGDPRPMRVYVEGLAHAARLRATPVRDQDPVANGYAHGYFDALDALLAPLVGGEFSSGEEKLWKLVLELRAEAMAPVPFLEDRAQKDIT